MHLTHPDRCRLQLLVYILRSCILQKTQTGYRVHTDRIQSCIRTEYLAKTDGFMTISCKIQYFSIHFSWLFMLMILQWGKSLRHIVISNLRSVKNNVLILNFHISGWSQRIVDKERVWTGLAESWRSSGIYRPLAWILLRWWSEFSGSESEMISQIGLNSPLSLNYMAKINYTFIIIFPRVNMCWAIILRYQSSKLCDDFQNYSEDIILVITECIWRLRQI